MNQDDALLVQRLSGRVAELESWLALLITRHGRCTQHGYTYVLHVEDAEAARALMPRGELAVSVSFDDVADLFVLDAI